MAARRRWLQFSLRGLLAMLTALAVCLGVVANNARQQREAVETIKAMGGKVLFGGEPENAVWPWLRELFGEPFGRDSIQIFVGSGRVAGMPPDPAELLPFEPTREFNDDGLKAIGKLPAVSGVWLHRVSLSDDGLKHLESCAGLRMLYLLKTGVSAAGVQRLQKRLPECKIVHN